MVDFLIVHGAWSSGWAWKKMRPLLRGRGHEIFTPSMTGLGERSHQSSPAIDLETHIADILAVVEYENLQDFVLVGHSYGGMVATGVADRLGRRVAHLIYLDAFAPRDGEALLDLVPPDHRERIQANAIDGWRVPPNPLPPDTPAEDRAWAEPRRVPQPIGTFTQKVALPHGEPKQPRTYIYCAWPTPGDAFRRFLERAHNEGWGYFEVEASHNPHITAPDVLADVFEEIISPA